MGTTLFLTVLSPSRLPVLSREACNEGEGDPPLYVNVNMFSGQPMNTWIDSLQAFFPGLQVPPCPSAALPPAAPAAWAWSLPSWWLVRGGLQSGLLFGQMRAGVGWPSGLQCRGPQRPPGFPPSTEPRETLQG